MRISLVFRESGEIAFSGEAESPLAALRVFYDANGWPPFLWLDDKRIDYDKENPRHLQIDLDCHWSVYLAG